MELLTRAASLLPSGKYCIQSSHLAIMWQSNSTLMPSSAENTESIHTGQLGATGQNAPYSNNLDELTTHQDPSLQHSDPDATSENPQTGFIEYPDWDGEQGRGVGMPLQTDPVEYLNSYGSLDQDIQLPPQTVEYLNSYGSLGRDAENSHPQLTEYTDSYSKFCSGQNTRC